MMLVHINIGSNIGDSRSAIERAAAAVFKLSEGAARRSEFISTEPWGFESPNRFLNLGVEIETTLPPLEMLDRLQQIEASISTASHRNPDNSYRDRLIDIDIIFILEKEESTEQACAEYAGIKFPGYRMLTMDYPRLTLPHPRALERDFVLIPLRQLHPCASTSTPLTQTKR